MAVSGAQPTSTANATAASAGGQSSKSWRVVDIVIAAVLGIATGVIFYGWNFVGGAGYGFFDAITPGLAGLVAGVWLLGGVIGGLIIRKPGAAIAVELIAAVFSAAVGSAWGITTVYSGLAQGLGAELIFLLFAYRRWGLTQAVLAGMGAGAGAWLLELFVTPNLGKSFSFNAIYLSCLVISGAVLAGVLGWALVKALAQTGALSRFAAGREAHGDI